MGRKHDVYSPMQCKLNGEKMELIIKSLRRIISSPSSVLIPDANRNSFAMMNVYKTQGKCRNTAMPNRAKMFWHLLFIILEWVHNNTYLRYLQLCIFLADFIEPVLWFFFFFDRIGQNCRQMLLKVKHSSCCLNAISPPWRSVRISQRRITQDIPEPRSQGCSVCILI